MKRKNVQERVQKRVDTVGRGKGKDEHQYFPSRLLDIFAHRLSSVGNLLRISMRRP